MADQIEGEDDARETEPVGPSTEGAVRIASIVLAVVALAGISAGASLSLRRS